MFDRIRWGWRLAATVLVMMAGQSLPSTWAGATGGATGGATEGADRVGGAEATEVLPPGGADLTTLLLSWQRDPATTMTIQFLYRVQQDEPEEDVALPKPMAITYQVDQADAGCVAWTASLPLRHWPGRTLQRAELTGLEPDTLYRFRVGDDPTIYRFRTMPATHTRPIRFVAGGDTRHRQSWMERMNRQAMVYEPDFVVWAGDLAYANADMGNLDRWEEWFAANTNELVGDGNRLVPIIVAIGNHEVHRGYYSRHTDYQHTNSWRERIAPYFYQLFAFPGHPGYNVLDFGNYLSLVILDTEHAAAVAGAQTAWLKQTLASRVDVPHVIPVYHVPAYPSVRDFDGPVNQRVREHWVPLFEQFNVRAAFEAHDHAYKRSEPIRAGQVDPGAGVVYLGDGAWGVGVRDVHDPETTWYLAKAQKLRHGIVVTLDGDRQHFVTVAESGEVIDEYVTRNR